MSSAAASTNAPTRHLVYRPNAAEDSTPGEDVLRDTEPRQDAREESPVVMQRTTEGGEGSSELAVTSETLRAVLPVYSARPRHIHVRRNIIIGVTLVVSVLVFLAY